MIHTRPRDVSVLTARGFSQCRFTTTTFGWGDTTAVNKRENAREVNDFQPAITDFFGELKAAEASSKHNFDISLCPKLV